MVDFQLPRVIADGVYELLEVLGEGGMAVVYRGHVDRERFDYPTLLEGRNLSRSESRRVTRSERGGLGQRYKEMTPHMLRQLCDSRGLAYPTAEFVAIKVLKASVAQNAERFLDEWLGLLGISHPNLVCVYGGGHDVAADLYYYAMELVENRLGDQDVLELPLQDKLEITRQAALGLGCLHEHGIIHRDVKPDNVICQRVGRTVCAKISDLGIAKDIDRSVELTMPDQVLGTPCFMAPELTRGAGEATRSADVYSLGAALYTWLSGKSPYHGKGLYSILGSLTNGLPPVSLKELVPLPPPVQHLVELLMALDPAVRPKSMDEAISRIDWAREALAGDSSALSVPVSPPAATPLPSSHVLVVDDDAQLQRLLRRSLTRMGVEVTIASNGAEALMRLHEQQFSLIVSDINMPALDGMMLLNILKGQSVATPVCFLTGARTPSIVQQASMLGAVAVLDKPVNFAELATIVQRYCLASA